MRYLLAVLIMSAAIISTTVAFARGGQDADDCPPGSTDPDCRTKPQ
jgi:hypothetical protein